jgi:hypothetical protein
MIMHGNKKTEDEIAAGSSANTATTGVHDGQRST